MQIQKKIRFDIIKFYIILFSSNTVIGTFLRLFSISTKFMDISINQKEKILMSIDFVVSLFFSNKSVAFKYSPCMDSLNPNLETHQ